MMERSYNCRDQSLFQFAILALSGIIWSVVTPLLVTDYRGAPPGRQPAAVRGALAYIAEATATRAAQADEDYAAAPAGDDTAAALGITPAHQVLVTRARHYAADGVPIQHAEITIPPGTSTAAPTPSPATDQSPQSDASLPINQCRELEACIH